MEEKLARKSRHSSRPKTAQAIQGQADLVERPCFLKKRTQAFSQLCFFFLDVSTIALWFCANPPRPRDGPRATRLLPQLYAPFHRLQKEKKNADARLIFA